MTLYNQEKHGARSSEEIVAVEDKYNDKKTVNREARYNLLHMVDVKYTSRQRRGLSWMLQKYKHREKFGSQTT